MGVPLPRLVALSPGTLAPGGSGPFLAALARALAAGLPGLLLREPGLTDRATLDLARELRARCSAAGTWFALHDRAHLAEEVAADAVHLSFRSLRPTELAWLPRTIARGLSTHASDAAHEWEGADYLFHGPLHAVSGKPEPVGLAGMARARARSALPLLALGGVQPADVPALRSTGLHGVAVRAGILGAPDPAAATRAYLEALA
ncbi:MAG TPA: thiamine phosphate synthase [Planctomycetota bacterium]